MRGRFIEHLTGTWYYAVHSTNTVSFDSHSTLLNLELLLFPFSQMGKLSFKELNKPLNVTQLENGEEWGSISYSLWLHAACSIQQVVFIICKHSYYSKHMLIELYTAYLPQFFRKKKHYSFHWAHNFERFPNSKHCKSY